VDAFDARDPYSYEPFTRHDFYRDINDALVARTLDRLPAQPSQRAAVVVDLGCGTGALTALLVDAFRGRGVPVTMSGIEPSASALAIAARRLPAAANVRLLEGDVSTMAGLAPLDMVFFANAIHLVADTDD
jgi:trans-aconitate methyltransferase